MESDSAPRSPLDASTSETQAESTSAGSQPSRRAFLGGGLSAAALAGGGVLLPSLSGQGQVSANVPQGTPRKVQAYKVRQEAALDQLHAPEQRQFVNGDEVLYPDYIANFTKGLPHNAFGEVLPSAYHSFKQACLGGRFGGFESLPSGEPDPSRRMRFVNPLAGVAFDLEGRDCYAFVQPPPPAFASAEEAGEIVENYWMALLRDVPFHQFASHPLAAAACADLSAMSDFRGPKVGGAVTPATLFRDNLFGALPGPWVSQFFWRSQPFGAQHIEPRVRTTAPGINFMTSPAAWLEVQNGRRPGFPQTYDPTLRWIRNGRDIGEWVHIDVLYQAYFQAALHLMTPPDPSNPFTGGGLGLAPNPGNPYVGSQMQDGFGTFGGPFFMTILCEVATRALKAVWHQKWLVHRRLRPEVFAGRVHHKLVSGRPYPLHSDVLGSQAVAQVYSANGSYMLPMAFPEGSPIHPSYGAGHATVAGACVTLLKALFDTQVPFPTPMQASDDGLSLLPYTGPDAGAMTVEGELNKLAQNVAFGRNIAGVHWRTDGSESMRLGEEVAISLLRDQRGTYAEPFDGFTFRRFDGSVITV